MNFVQGLWLTSVAPLSNESVAFEAGFEIECFRRIADGSISKTKTVTVGYHEAAVAANRNLGGFIGGLHAILIHVFGLGMPMTVVMVVLVQRSKAYYRTGMGGLAYGGMEVQSMHILKSMIYLIWVGFIGMPFMSAFQDTASAGFMFAFSMILFVYSFVSVLRVFGCKMCKLRGADGTYGRNGAVQTRQAIEKDARFANDMGLAGVIKDGTSAVIAEKQGNEYVVRVNNEVVQTRRTQRNSVSPHDFKTCGVVLEPGSSDIVQVRGKLWTYAYKDGNWLSDELRLLAEQDLIIKDVNGMVSVPDVPDINRPPPSKALYSCAARIDMYHMLYELMYNSKRVGAILNFVNPQTSH